MLIILVSLYLTIGTGVLIDDMRQPYYNQPMYLNKGSFFTKFIPIFLWPITVFEILKMEKFRPRYIISIIAKNIFIGIVIFLIYYFCINWIFSQF